MSSKGKKNEHEKKVVALNSEIRRRILLLLRDSKEPLSPRQMAKDFRVPLSSLAYHVRVLSECKMVTLANEQPVRGAVEHFYRYSLDDGWAQKLLEAEPA